MRSRRWTQGEPRGHLEDAHRGQPHGAAVRGVVRRVDLGDVDGTHSRVVAGEERRLERLARREPTGEAGGAARGDGAVADVEVKVDVDRRSAGAGDVERL